jgi:hypothetical protein
LRFPIVHHRVILDDEASEDLFKGSCHFGVVEFEVSDL